MSDDYGKEITLALRAVAQLHADSAKLLRDFDKRMPGWTSLFATNATKDLTYSINSDRYMAGGLYRYYVKKEMPALARGLTICFDDPKTDEPLMIVGEIIYNDVVSFETRVCDGWDLWHLYFASAERPLRNKLLELHGPGPSASAEYPHPERVASARLIAIALYEIQSLDTVQALVNQVAG